MPWDSDKSTAADPDNPQADEQLTADEWDNHVSEGHFSSDELNFGVDGNGDPVITDPQNGGQTVMRYDRSAGSWVVDTLEATNDVTTPIVRDDKDPQNLYETESVTLDKGGTVSLSSLFEGDGGILFISQNRGESNGIFSIAGQYAEVVTTIFDGRNANFSSSQGTANSVNVYYDVSDYQIENTKGDNNQITMKFLSDV